MQYLIVGSLALSQYNYDRKVKDIDVICYKGTNPEWILSFLFPYRQHYKTIKEDDYSATIQTPLCNIELLYADKQESLQYILERENQLDYGASVATLYALKMGHIYYPNKSWQKHMDDIVWMRQNKMDQLNYHKEYIDHLIKLHRQSTKKRIGSLKTPSLNKSKDEFFDDNVTKYYDHDYIHQCMAHKDKPMFMYMQKDDGTVQCHKDLWDTFSFEEKCWCVLEESYVIALERHIIPTVKGDKIGLQAEEAFKWALMRICTTLCSGWFRAFAVNNYEKILEYYNSKYYEKFVWN